MEVYSRKMYDKLKVFEKELQYINNPKIRGFTEKVISNMPEYFFETAASSTGKYHPRYALGRGGLVRHTKVAVDIAVELLRLEQNTLIFNLDEKDCIISALICHDGWKHGDAYSQYSVSEHPVIAADHVLKLADEDEKEFAKLISDNIRSHMGEWNTDYKTKEEIMPKPSTLSEKFVHECDYLASRKAITYELEDYYDPNRFNTIADPKLKDKINELIELCKSKLSSGVDREEIYKEISFKNGGNKNPNSIKNISTVSDLIDIIRNM